MGWIDEQTEKIQELEGTTIDRYSATEMAFKGGEGDGVPEYNHPDLPFLQLWFLNLHLTTGEIRRFQTYQNDDVWGVFSTSSREPDFKSWEPDLTGEHLDGIYRTRALDDFPFGEITSVDIVINRHGDIGEVTIDFSGDSILLCPGEVILQSGGRMSVMKWDESVLLFRHPHLKSRVQFWENACAMNLGFSWWMATHGENWRRFFPTFVRRCILPNIVIRAKFLIQSGGRRSGYY